MKLYPTFAEIDLSALRHNLIQLQKHILPNCNIMAVVKADAYGHGLADVALKLVKSGVTVLGVVSLTEGIALRKAGIKCPILILGGIYPGQELDCISFDLSTVIFSSEQLYSLDNAADQCGQIAKIHLKVDTGMGRLGISIDDLDNILNTLKSMKYIFLEGVLSHLSSADAIDEESINYTTTQIEYFAVVVTQIRCAGFSPDYVHIANSAGSLNMNLTFCNMIRLGIVLYGELPAAHLTEKLNLLPVMTLKSKVAMLKWMQTGKSISYSRSYITTKNTLVASIPVGYVDGYRRAMTNKSEVLIRCNRAKVIGTICMDWIMLDVTDIEGVRVGDEVVLLGSDGSGNHIRAQELADWAGTIPYEILCSISNRVPRIYIGK